MLDTQARDEIFTALQVSELREFTVDAYKSFNRPALAVEFPDGSAFVLVVRPVVEGREGLAC